MIRASLLLLLILSGSSFAELRINEFLADNTATSLADEDGDTPDWIELRNTTGVPVSLAGWHLTDDAGDLTKWRLPDVSIPDGGYLVVFASGKDRAPVIGDNLHTNFLLAQTGEYVALVEPDGITVRSEFGPAGSPYPNQRSGVSYGYFGTPEVVGFMFSPTPGGPNDPRNAVLGFVDDTEFDVDRGFFSAPFDVTITSDTPGAEIRYTTDGSWPSETEGTLYTRPVVIDRTLPLKAIAYKAGFVPSNVDTQTYVFVDDVVTQTPATTQSDWGLPATWNGQGSYYGMNGNPRIDPLTHPTMRDDLKVVPTLSISMETDDLFGQSGIYANPQGSGVQWERWTSLEFIDPAQPDGSNDFQQNCAIRIQGGAFRSFGLTRKKSFRVLFKSEWGTQGRPTGGPGKLDYPLFGPDATSEFQTLVFRMESNDGWQWSGAGTQPLYARDEFGRRAQLALGQAASHGRFCHLYLNGVYWGLYNIVERPDAGFAESYFGARRDSWQGQNSGMPINDTPGLADWNAMLNVVNEIGPGLPEFDRDALYLRACGFKTDGSKIDGGQVWIDPDNIVDYLLVNWYGGNSDWPFKNYYCGRAREAGTTGYKFFMWDAEWSLNLRSSIGTNLTGDFRGVAQPQQYLERSPEYRVRFGDRAHRALFNDGVFTPAQALALWEEITRDHLSILNPEAARWGNQHGGQHTITSWRGENRRLVHPDTGWFVQRPPAFLNQLRTRDLYPELEAPLFTPHGGSVPEGSGPTLSVPDDVTEIYYLFGPGAGGSAGYTHPLDPRLLGGGINPAATLIDFGAPGNGAGTNRSAPLALSGSGFLYARSYNSATGEWSALNTALYTLDTVPAAPDNIVISEVHYHPASPNAAELAAGYDDQDLFEFLEVQNISDFKVDMSNVDFIDGVEFVFPPGFTLAPGQQIVIVRDLGAFALRYPSFPPENLAGAFLNGSGLRNSGETLTMRAADGSIIKSFAYGDLPPWPTDPDGITGVSLVLISPANNPDHTLPANWRAAGMAGGNPGGNDALVFSGDPDEDLDRDGLSAYLEHALGRSDSDPANDGILSFGSRAFEVSGGLDDYFTVSFPRDLRAEDVELVPQASVNLIDWGVGPVDLVFVSEVHLGGTISLVTYRASVPTGTPPELFVRLLARAK